MKRTLDRLGEHIPASFRERTGMHWNRPTGGFFLAVTVPFVADNAALARSAEDYGVIWTPMSYFYPAGGGEHGIRLSISYLTPEQIDEGVARLARFITAEIRTAGTGEIPAAGTGETPAAGTGETPAAGSAEIAGAG
jgi:(S)-3,5-dihydroxyphenylglycine transaminase